MRSREGGSDGTRSSKRKEERDAVHQMSNLTAASVPVTGAEGKEGEEGKGPLAPQKVRLRSIQDFIENESKS